jgi:hypothetical protein
MSLELIRILLSWFKDDCIANIPFSPFIFWNIDNINNEINIKLKAVLKTLVRFDSK